jgi:hypothetical protein
VNVTVDCGGYPKPLELAARVIVIVFVSVLNAVFGSREIVSAACAAGIRATPAAVAVAKATAPAARRRRTTMFMGLPVRCDGGRSFVLSAVVLIT